jgi:hypothetical protein
MSERYLKEREDLGPEAGKEHIVRCQACDKSSNREELSRCRGCEAVWYCDKVACNPFLISCWRANCFDDRHVRRRAGVRGVIKANAKS